ncbi:hypothetical protein ASPVEDRAFT_83695 [Aspergillus versicolor CBS 583.65]|uniref:Uncharacterized protein n=1 Tax=Aspergillus versicolor CBS 583.65 TaxID=1036611 RepID=A0A1L9PKY0_ASPVE|nr:uncharacterized protein ASPVEDRAFT_83695 [Aspergillus versicolor CBS 583.65]OJJ02184.1 hypothetical protein ASPVEDRAFT_83695 [Aspergillus versicolor CBS 583.65]
MSKIPNNGKNSSYVSMDRKLPTHPTRLRVTRGSQDKPWNHPHVVSNYMGGVIQAIQAQRVHEQLPCLRYVYDPSRPPRTGGIRQDQSGELRRASPNEKHHASHVPQRASRTQQSTTPPIPPARLLCPGA